MKDVMLILHFIGLVMGVGTSFAFMFLGMAASKLEKTEAQRFMIKALVLERMGHIGLTLLILSGGYLMTPFWSALPSMPYLIAKLVFVLILIVIIIRIARLSRKARQEGGEAYLEKIPKIGRLGLPVGIIIVILAVLSFH